MKTIYKLCSCLIAGKSKSSSHTMFHFTELDKEGVCKFCGYYGIQLEQKAYSEFVKSKANGKKSTDKVIIEDYKALIRG